ncbi:MAG: arylsulfatase [Clostridium sp.]|uniref:arylsulfatase n=1 Tax=Clostridium sp. TaxID=1506 RepID=UPI0039EA7CE3
MARNTIDEFEGIIRNTVKESVPYFPEEIRPPKNSPNVVYIVLDDMGFAQLGCYGSNINTPNIDALAKGGLRYNNFHTTAICSATRASLLSGANHHSVGVGTVADFANGFPNSRGRVDNRYALVSEILKEVGYSTFALGKWHLAPNKQTSPAGPYDHWPLQRGFDKYCGFLSGMTNQWNPDLVQGNERIRQPKTAEEGYHLTEDLTDKAIEYIASQKSVAEDKPFFLYLAYGAMHSPHHAPKEFIDRYKGKFDEGWDALRERWYENQRKLGIIPEDAELTERNELAPAWDSLSIDEKKLYAKFMEVYAGFLEHTDYHIGRLIDYLREINQLDNTVVVLISDNGASAEGGPHGRINQYKSMSVYPVETIDFNLENVDKLGTPFAFNHYPLGWANLGNVPFKWYKVWVHSGGVRDPLIIHYPQGIKDKGGIRNQYHHVIDITPTILDIIGIQKPKTIKGFVQKPFHGVSLKYTFDSSQKKTKKRIQYYEQLGHRAIWSEGWKAVANHFYNDNYEDDIWELYNTEEDFSENHDLAKKYPEKLKELINLWWLEAGKYGVLPLADFNFHKIKKRLVKPSAAGAFTFYGGSKPLSNSTAPVVADRSYEIIANVTRNSSEDDGVIVASGGRFGGYSLYIKDNKLKYHYNYVGEKRYSIISDFHVPVGELELKFKFEKTGQDVGIGKLFINDKEVGSATIKDTSGNVNLDLFSIGSNEMTPVTEEYKVPFEFKGRIQKVIYNVREDGDNQDYVLEHELATE